MTNIFSIRSLRWCVATGLVALLAAAPAAAAQRPRAHIDQFISAAMAQRGALQGARQRVIVRLDPKFLSAVRVLQQRSGYFRRNLNLISAITLELPTAAIDPLSRMPGVLSVSVDAPLEAQQLGGVVGGVTQTVAGVFTPQTISLARTLGLKSTDPKGKGVTIGVVDSGIAPSAEFGNRIKAFYDFTKGGIATAPYDNYGHGTHVAGLIAGNGASSNGAYAGVAPQANLVGFKVLDGNGAGYTSDVINALDFATTNKAALGLDILNLSLGHPPFEPAATDPLVAAVDRASAAGIVVIVSSGNAGVNPRTGLPGYAGVTSPGNARSALTVGSQNTQNTARRTDDLVAPYSSRGPSWFDGYAKPDFVAPGHKLVAPAAPGSFLVTTYPNLLGLNSTGNLGYLKLTGTSMAAAVASGAVALMHRSEPGGDAVWPDAPGADAQRDQGDARVQRVPAEGRARRRLRPADAGCRRHERRRARWRWPAPSTPRRPTARSG